ncbi:gamma-glutamylcyclotransferase [Alicyclobacillus mali]|uniref:Gamma-glutamylcyclotransferase family protein n=1 Tax=Alicyclobacillus mali (ex Roth et al. 2021) TaxID=1123961 RepID=A0ABS0EZ75_9BACL|nr:gamma-glutamylcyclotransferase family protein [Alicyclobacillus mali (ex Roth et al. 2021)]MBF8376339.1 gamma-glutamylcyclotransferase [Alicyclobacillus mali (ex Roth et al. 2021)]
MGVHTVFVYGTLRKGQPNRPVMEPYLVADLGEGQIRGAMYDLGPFPAVTLEEDGVVTGEWVRVTDEGLARLDRLESYPRFYDRAIVSDTANGLRGWVYCMARRKVDGYERVESGDWVKRLEQKTALSR